MKIRYTRPARQDVAALLTYTKQHWPSNVQRIGERLSEVEHLIAMFPESGSPTERQGVRRHGLSPFPFVIFYRVTRTEILIIRVYHAAQRFVGIGKS